MMLNSPGPSPSEPRLRRNRPLGIEDLNPDVAGVQDVNVAGSVGVDTDRAVLLVEEGIVLRLGAADREGSSRR